MNVFSKLSRDYSCHELGHTFSSSCTTSWWIIAKVAFFVSFKTYFPIYLISALLRKQDKNYYLYSFLPEVLRSTLFLGTNGSLFLFGFCLWRALTNFKMCTVGFLPSMLASLIAIQIERSPRRSLLAVYMSTVAFEALYMAAKFRGLVKPLPLGEMWYFSPVAALYMYLFKLDKFGSAITSLLQILVGREEKGKGPIRQDKESGSVSSTLSLLLAILCGKMGGGPGNKHVECRHKESCLQYTVEGGLRSFGIGLTVQTLLTMVSNIRLLFKAPLRYASAILSRRNLKFGAFLGSFSAIYRICQCILRHMRNKDSNWHSLVSGWLASWSFLFYRKTSLALYLSSKMVETLCRLSVTSGRLTSIPGSIPLLYAVSTSIIFHLILVEPHNVPPAYYSFIRLLTGEKITEINRHLLDELGTHASNHDPSFWPKYDPSVTYLAQFNPTTFKASLARDAAY